MGGLGEGGGSELSEGLREGTGKREVGYFEGRIRSGRVDIEEVRFLKGE